MNFPGLTRRPHLSAHMFRSSIAILSGITLRRAIRLHGASSPGNAMPGGLAGVPRYVWGSSIIPCLRLARPALTGELLPSLGFVIVRGVVAAGGIDI